MPEITYHHTIHTKGNKMKINVIDYRGGGDYAEHHMKCPVINSRGDSLFSHRTKYFKKMQRDFHRWKEQGHEFICYTQHKYSLDDHKHFDQVIECEQMPCHDARNRILDDTPQGEWIGVWDNDATLYWDKLRSDKLPKELEAVCKQAQEQGIVSYVPFNSQQAPYPTDLDCTQWTFKPTIHQKGTMMFVQNIGVKWPTHLNSMSDLARAVELTKLGHKTAQLQQASLNEHANTKSTIFRVNAYHVQYQDPGPNSDPMGMLKWDSQADRREKYLEAKQQIESDYNSTLPELQQEQNLLWKQPEMFDELFDVIQPFNEQN